MMKVVLPLILAALFICSVSEAARAQSSGGYNARDPLPLAQPQELIVKFEYDASICAGDSILLVPEVFGGQPPYVFEWTPTAGLNDPTTRFPLASPAATTTYTVLVTDADGAIATAQIRVTVQPILDVGFEGPRNMCPGSTSKYTATGDGIEQYNWAVEPPGGVSIIGQGTSEIEVDWLQAGTYTVTLTGYGAGSSCAKDTAIIVKVTDELEPIVTVDGDLSLCLGDSVVLTADAGYDSYEWTPTGERTRSIVAKASGTYSVRVTATADCAGSSDPITVNVSSMPTPNAIIVSSAGAICAGDSVVLGTTESYERYLWSTGETTPMIVTRSAGKYSVMVANGGCEDESDTLTLDVSDRPVASLTASSSTQICAEDSVMLQATSGFAYSWRHNGNALSETSDRLVARAAGRYWAIVSNSAGCETITNEIEVTIKPPPQVEIEGQGSLCIGQIAEYSISPLSGTTLWEIDPPSLGTIRSGQNTERVSILWSAGANGILRVRVTVDGCAGIAELPIAISDKLQPRITASGPLEFCEGSSVTLNADPGYVSYLWTKDGSEIATSRSLTITTKGSYTLHVTSSDGCEGESLVDIAVHPLPAKPVITRVGGELVSTVARTYTWSIDGIEIVDGTGQTQAAGPTGMYTVTITDSNGCENTSDPLYIGGAHAHVALKRWVSGEAHQPLEVPLELVSSHMLLEVGAKSYVAAIRFNNTVLSTQLAAAVQANQSVITVTGEVTVREGILQTLTFEGLPSVVHCDDILIDTFYFVDAPVDVTTSDGYVCVTDECTPGAHAGDAGVANFIWLAPPHPNPASGELHMEFVIPHEGITRAIVRDVLGREVRVLVEEHLHEGTHERSVNISGLPSGRYVLILASGSQTHSRLLEIIR